MFLAATSVRSMGRLLPLLAAILIWWAPAAGARETPVPAETRAGPGPVINEIMAANVSTIVEPDNGAFADWIEIYNPGTEAVDLGHFALTDDIRNPVRWTIPAGTVVPAGGYILVWADRRDSDGHSNFRLSRDGEEVALYAPDGTLVDMVRFGDQVGNVSYGRSTDGAAEWAFFQWPTPGRANEGVSVPSARQASPPEFSQHGGRYETPVELALSASAPTAEIRFTLDGSSPTPDSELYTEPIQLAETAVVRARTFTDDSLASPIRTHTYLIGEKTQLPIVSLVTDPVHLWDSEFGIYVDENIDARKDWERPASVALYEPDGSLGFQAEANIRLFGRSAIYLPQKSLAVFITDAGNGTDRLSYRLFPDRELEQYAAFILRSGSDDWAGTMLRDGFGQEALFGTMELGTQAIRPALLFVNGSYFGIHNIREKQNEDYLVTRAGADLNNLDLLFVGHNHGDGSVDVETLHGGAGAYEEMVSFAVNRDLTVPENFAAVRARLNTDHFIDYIIAESYVGNVSWHRNRKVWRAQPPNDRWDFLVYDLDRGFGRRYTNTLQDILSLDPLFGALLTNENFKNQFVQRFAHHLNVTYEPARMVSLVDRLKEDVAPEIERHRDRWQVQEWWAENYEREAHITGRQVRPELPSWQDEIAHVKEFIRERPDALRQHLVEAFSLSGTQFLTLTVNEVEGGRILVEGLPLPSTPFTGVYFRDMPLRLTAVAEPGYQFAGWEGSITSREETVSILLTGNETMTAVFKPTSFLDNWSDPQQLRSWAIALALLLAVVGLVGFVERWLGH